MKNEQEMQAEFDTYVERIKALVEMSKMDGMARLYAEIGDVRIAEYHLPNSWGDEVILDTSYHDEIALTEAIAEKVFPSWVEYSVFGSMLGKTTIVLTGIRAEEVSHDSWESLSSIEQHGRGDVRTEMVSRMREIS